MMGTTKPIAKLEAPQVRNDQWNSNRETWCQLPSSFKNIQKQEAKARFESPLARTNRWSHKRQFSASSLGHLNARAGVGNESFFNSSNETLDAHGEMPNSFPRL